MIYLNARLLGMFKIQGIRLLPRIIEIKKVLFVNIVHLVTKQDPYQTFIIIGEITFI